MSVGNSKKNKQAQSHMSETILVAPLTWMLAASCCLAIDKDGPGMAKYMLLEGYALGEQTHVGKELWHRMELCSVLQDLSTGCSMLIVTSPLRMRAALHDRVT